MIGRDGVSVWIIRWKRSCERRSDHLRSAIGQESLPKNMTGQHITWRNIVLL